MTTIAWFRRDLRLHDHAVLATALSQAVAVQPVFVFDTDILARFSNPDDRRLSFLAATLCSLDTELRKRGGGMLVLYGRAQEIMPALAQALQAVAVVAATDFEPATIARDAAVKQQLASSARFVQVLDHVLNDPRRMLKADGTPYKVFTPFYRKCWRPAIGEGEIGELAVNDAGRYARFADSKAKAEAASLRVLPVEQGPHSMLEAIGYRYRDDPLWPSHDGPARLSAFAAQPVRDYKQARDFMAEHGTSRLSPYLRHGQVSIREAMRAAQASGGAEPWIFELGWREFYMAILTHFPQVLTQEFAPQYRNGAIAWNRDEVLAQRFMAGKTGYPVVDAAVRELTSTGWMHNRARMIVASFFTKHLLMDWRVGEEFFAQHLMDYELASNNGGWQWAASTGTDAQPYFRVFNPVLQSQKFDAQGEYIRRYVPELAALSSKDIHAPWASANPPANYPAPIVDHATARARAIAAFKAAGRGD